MGIARQGSAVFACSLIAPAVTAGDGAAQSGCGGIEDCVEDLYHVFAEDQGVALRFPEPGDWHGQCLVCQIVGKDSDPGKCHDPGCIPEEEEENQLAYNRALDAASRRDVRGLIAAASDIPHRAMVHPERKAIQLVGCDGWVVASLPLGDLYEVAIQTVGVNGSLPRAVAASSIGPHL
jgi:hypothetical protein